MDETKPIEPMIGDAFTQRPARPDDSAFTDEDRLVSAIATLMVNMKDIDQGALLAELQDLIAEIDELINLQINEVLHTKKFYEMEHIWRCLEDLIKNVNFKANIQVDLLDVSKD